MLDLLIITFASWYLAYSITSTHGPGGVFDWLREHVWHGRHGKTLVHLTSAAGTTPPELLPSKNGLLDCPVCLSFWVALLLLIAPMGVVTQALGVAGAAMILHGWSGWRFER